MLLNVNSRSNRQPLDYRTNRRRLPLSALNSACHCRILRDSSPHKPHLSRLPRRTSRCARRQPRLPSRRRREKLNHAKPRYSPNSALGKQTSLECRQKWASCDSGLAIAQRSHHLTPPPKCPPCKNECCFQILYARKISCLLWDAACKQKLWLAITCLQTCSI